MVEDGRLSAGHARCLVPVADPALQQKIAEKVAGDELSVRQTEQLVKQLTRPAKEPKPQKPDPLGVDYAAVAAKELGDKLGRRVKIVTGRRKGRLELEYYGVDDLNGLLEELSRLQPPPELKPEGHKTVFHRVRRETPLCWISSLSGTTRKWSSRTSATNSRTKSCPWWTRSSTCMPGSWRPNRGPRPCRPTATPCPSRSAP